MPEGPEVAFLKEYIHARFRGHVLKDIEIKWGRYVRHGPPANYETFKESLPLKLTHIDRKGKVTFFHFDKGWCIISKLGMTGWWHAQRAERDKNDSSAWMPPERQNVQNVIMHFDHKALIYTDIRNFGTLTITQDPKVIGAEMSKLAPDVMDHATTYRVFQERVAQKMSTRLLEDVLMDQTCLVCGIGNYLKAEILYAAKVSPRRPMNKVSQEEWRAIFNAAKRITRLMSKQIVKESTQGYIDSMKVYRRDTDPHGNIVMSHTAKNGRTTFWVPAVQT